MSPVPMMPLAAALLLLLVPGSLGKHPATATATNNPTKQGTFATSASSCTSTEYFVTPTSTCSNCDPSTGVCQDSSCVVFGFPNSAKANCANGGCDPAYCSYFAGCSITETTGVQHCFGITRCSDGSTTCAGAGNGYGYGNLCLQDGTSGNFKICGGVSVLAADSPNPSASPSKSPSPSPTASKSPLPSPSKSPAPSQSPSASRSPLPAQSPAPTPSPAASQSPDASLSPNPSPSASPAPSPTAEVCAAANTALDGQYASFQPSGCDPSFIQSVQVAYNCTEASLGCGNYVCSIPMSNAVAAQLAQCQLA